MRKKIYFLTMMILCCFLDVYSSKLEFIAIECQDELIIPEDMNIKDLKVEYLIKCKYKGKDIRIKKNEKNIKNKYRSNSLIRSFDAWGEIYYIDKEGKILPEALKYSKECGLNLCITTASPTACYGGECIALRNNEIYSWPLFLFNSWLYDKTEVDEAILNKTLSTIVLIIKKVEVRWTVFCDEFKLKGKIELKDINRIKIIRIKYKKKK